MRNAQSDAAQPPNSALRIPHSAIGPDPALVWLEAIARRLDELAPPTPAADPALVWLEAIARRLDELAPPPAAEGLGLTEVQQGLAALEKQIGRAGREQLKANSLAAAQSEQLTATLESLRAATTRQDEALAALRAQERAAVTGARLAVVESLLPVLDRLDDALRAGQELLARPRPAPPAAPPPPSLFARLRGAPPDPPPAPPPADPALRVAMAAWLVGLGFVRDRLLAVLAAEGVSPLETEGHPFDAARHVALEAVPATADHPTGTVVRELRRGYLAGDRVLRYAEVAVAK
jgi:molecular chaperone GrpE